jgi:hypothetical protein
LPTAVCLFSLEASGSLKQVTLRWRTAVETQVLGYHFLRTHLGRAIRVNDRLIRAKALGAARGSSYTLIDRGVRPAKSYTYRLQVVYEDGTRAWRGTRRVVVPAR